jgi:hypothetical protein
MSLAFVILIAVAHQSSLNYYRKYGFYWEKIPGKVAPLKS